MKTNLTCSCQDSAGEVCGKEMTLEEITDDGMCHWCADNVKGNQMKRIDAHFNDVGKQVLKTISGMVIIFLIIFGCFFL